MKLYNTLTRSLDLFEPRERSAVTIYVCGPTVYDHPHVGHGRSAFIFDYLRRYLLFTGLTVRFVRNITDVDDKIIEKARQEAGKDAKDLTTACQEVSRRYTASYHAAMDQLGLAPPDEEPRTTEHVVPDMTDFISKLLIQGAAYEAQGDVYFSVRKCPGYGTLSNRKVDELQAGGRVEPDEHPGPPGTIAARPGDHERRAGGAGKQDPMDFALWKAAKPGEPAWESPWGKGRPGWHIECSAMSTKLLGDAFDIHGGGVDLLFPHHENELAQAQGAGKPFARVWLHNGLLTVNGEKMSKSLGNVITVEQAITDCGGEPDALKMFFLGTHYRSPVDYTPRNITAASRRFQRLFHFFYFAYNRAALAKEPDAPPPEVARLEQEFQQAMDDDLNTPRALAALDKLATLGYQCEIELATQSPSNDQAEILKIRMVSAAQTLKRLGEEVFGLFSNVSILTLTAEQTTLLQQREAARRSKDFHTADHIRNEFNAKGLVVEDTPEGPIVLPKR